MLQIVLRSEDAAGRDGGDVKDEKLSLIVDGPNHSSQSKHSVRTVLYRFPLLDAVLGGSRRLGCDPARQLCFAQGQSHAEVFSFFFLFFPLTILLTFRRPSLQRLIADHRQSRSPEQRWQWAKYDTIGKTRGPVASTVVRQSCRRTCALSPRQNHKRPCCWLAWHCCKALSHSAWWLVVASVRFQPRRGRTTDQTGKST